MRTRKMLRAFLKTCRAVQLLHACVVKFKVSGTVLAVNLYQELGDIWKANPKYFRNIAVDDSNILYWQGLIVPVSTQPLFFVCVKDLCVC